MADALAAGSSVAFVGLGRMGTPMALRLLAAGYDVRGHDVAVGARRAFEDASGRDAFDTAAGAATGADALLLMLPDSRSVRDVATTEGVLEALADGGVVIDMSSSDPVQTRELAPEVERHGLGFLDAPVSGGVVGAEAGSLAIMVGGPDAAVARCRRVFDELGGSIHHVGEIGAGHAVKALNNLLSATHLLATVEAFEAGRRFGLDPERMLAAVNASSGRSFSTELKLPRYVFPETFDAGFSLALMSKDVQTALGLLRATGAPDRLAERTASLWDEAAVDLPGADHTEIARWSERLRRRD
jgi:3-hydroxyisobutyrate dehydrogenase